MLTRKQLSDLRDRMVNHKVFDDKAIVEVTAQELSDLLDLAEKGKDLLDLVGKPLIQVEAAMLCEAERLKKKPIG